MVTDQDARLPAVDHHLVRPEERYELVDGVLFAVSPALEPHARRHFKLGALLEAHAAEGWLGAADMLTRASERSDFAPDASIYPAARDPETGGRRLERLAFEVVSTETLAHSGRKAANLLQRGVARVFAIDVERTRALEWSVATGSWELLANDAVIEDPSLAVALPIAELLSTARADDAVARALLARRNPVLERALDDRHAEGRADGRAEGLAAAIVAVLAQRGIPLTATERAHIETMRDVATLDRWVARMLACTSAAELLGGADER